MNFHDLPERPAGVSMDEVITLVSESLSKFFDDGQLIDRPGFEAKYAQVLAPALKYPRHIADALVDAGMDPEMATAIAFDGLSALDQV